MPFTSGISHQLAASTTHLSSTNAVTIPPQLPPFVLSCAVRTQSSPALRPADRTSRTATCCAGSRGAAQARWCGQLVCCCRLLGLVAVSVLWPLHHAAARPHASEHCGGARTPVARATPWSLDNLGVPVAMKLLLASMHAHGHRLRDLQASTQLQKRWQQQCWKGVPVSGWWRPHVLRSPPAAPAAPVPRMSTPAVMTLLRSTSLSTVFA
jgi:hypothetical protein